MSRIEVQLEGCDCMVRIIHITVGVLHLLSSYFEDLRQNGFGATLFCFKKKLQMDFLGDLRFSGVGTARIHVL